MDLKNAFMMPEGGLKLVCEIVSTAEGGALKRRGPCAGRDGRT